MAVTSPGPLVGGVPAIVPPTIVPPGPTVTFTFPGNGAGAVPLATALTATFSEAMDPSSITASTFLLSSGSVTVPGSVTYAGGTATFTPKNNLTLNGLYTATI